MTTSARAAQEERTIARRRGKPSDETLHAASTAHMTARSDRLDAYVKSLEDELAADPSGAQAERLEGRLEQARKEAKEAKRRRVPRLREVVSAGDAGSAGDAESAGKSGGRSTQAAPAAGDSGAPQA